MLESRCSQFNVKCHVFQCLSRSSYRQTDCTNRSFSLVSYDNWIFILNPCSAWSEGERIEIDQPSLCFLIFFFFFVSCWFLSPSIYQICECANSPYNYILNFFMIFCYYCTLQNYWDSLFSKMFLHKELEWS